MSLLKMEIYRAIICLNKYEGPETWDLITDCVICNRVKYIANINPRRHINEEMGRIFK